MKNNNPNGNRSWIRKVRHDMNYWQKSAQDSRRRKLANDQFANQNKAGKIKNYAAKQEARQYGNDQKTRRWIARYEAKTRRMEGNPEVAKIKAIGNAIATNIAPATSSYAASTGVSAANSLINNNAKIADTNITNRKDEDQEDEETTGTNPFN